MSALYIDISAIIIKEPYDRYSVTYRTMPHATCETGLVDAQVDVSEAYRDPRKPSHVTVSQGVCEK